MKSWRIGIIVAVMLIAGCSGQKIDLSFKNDMIGIDGTISEIAVTSDGNKIKTCVYANFTIANKSDAPVIVDLSNVELHLDSLASTGIYYNKPDSAIKKLVYIKKGKTFVADVYWVFDSKIEVGNIKTAELTL